MYFMLPVKFTKSFSLTCHAGIQFIKGIFRSWHRPKPTWVRKVKTISKSPIMFPPLHTSTLAVEKRVRPICTLSWCYTRVKKYIYQRRIIINYKITHTYSYPKLDTQIIDIHWRNSALMWNRPINFSILIFCHSTDKHFPLLKSTST